VVVAVGGRVCVCGGVRRVKGGAGTSDAKTLV
jgi:hypothetical protein